MEDIVLMIMQREVHEVDVLELTDVEREILGAGHRCFFQGPIVLARELRDLFPLYGTPNCEVRRIAIYAGDQDGRTHRLLVRTWTKKQPDDDVGRHSTEHISFGDGDAAYAVFGQYVTIHGAEVRLWAPEHVVVPVAG